MCGWCFTFLLFFVSSISCIEDDVYNIGVGISDITGPASGVAMMGYVKISQVTSGIHFRLYSRAFIIDDNTTRIVFVSIDSCMVSQSVKTEVIKKLQEVYGDIYTESNVCISSSHTHSAPGGYLQYFLYVIPSGGFIRETFDAQVSGIFKSIVKAHENMQPGRIFWNQGELYNISVNRSPSAYLRNPPEERERYPYDVDKTMSLIKFVDLQDKPIGMINWFAVHATSMNNTNRLISGDNKGYASLRFEQVINGKVLPGKGPFVAAFAQANEGDSSPNIIGPRCSLSGKVCDFETSSCSKKEGICISTGPGKDMFESTKIIGERQYEKALELFLTATNKLTGPIQYVHQNIDMSNVEVTVNDTYNVKTCKPALGYSFAAGTTDSIGDSNFRQGARSSSIYGNVIRDLIKKPSETLKNCHIPKPILLATGEMAFPYKWHPTVLPTQILKVGQLAIVAVPAEFTTMAGRRLREAVEEVINETEEDNKTIAVIAGLSNAYSSYVTTYEEYQVQRYEGASTLYGPYTLDAYIQQYKMLANNMMLRNDLSEGPETPNLLSKQFSFNRRMLFNIAPFGKKFGDVLEDVKENYTVGSTVKVTFVSGHPINNMKLDDTFLTVEKWKNDTSEWEVVATDANWETKFYWKNSNIWLGSLGKAEILWDIPEDTEPGKYRIRHFGTSRNVLQRINSFEGISSPFLVIND
ncbi:neutral ceramidase-like [Centruroides sculpturatus]|uniref:neutral ceramidase-like n=2 Tax=Centruroides sculpturatus TaxID=218467 RepID=UPI000C6EE2DC|nr:neutral ceramidase-like [Centruroides sculpturatus]